MLDEKYLEFKRKNKFPIFQFSESLQELCRLPNSTTCLLEQPPIDFISKFSLSEKDIQGLLEIAVWIDGDAKALGEFYSAPIYAWNALMQFDPNLIVPEVLDLINHLDWDQVGGFRDEIQSMLTEAGSHVPETIPLLLEALKDEQRHETTRILLLDAAHNAIAETDGDWSVLFDYLTDQLKEFRIDCRQWYGAIVPELSWPDKPTPELVELLNKICLGSYADLSLVVPCDGLTELTGIDFETDPEYSPIYDEFEAIRRIMDDFWSCERTFPENAVLRARELRERIIPSLIERVRSQTAYARYRVPGERGTVQFAVHLLAEFDAKEALPTIFDSLSLTEEQIYLFLYKDGLFESMPGILRRLIGDDFEVYDRKLRDSQTPVALRNCLLRSLAYLVARDVVTEECYCELLRDYLELAVFEENGSFTTEIIDYIIHTRKEEYIPLVRDAYDKGLVDEERIASWEAVDFLEGKGNLLLSIQDMLPSARRNFSDAIEELSSWAWFQQEPERPPQPKPASPTVIDVSDGPPVLNLSSFGHSSLSYPSDNVESGQLKSGPKLGRNDPCPCGSGKKYKKCCLDNS